MWLTDWLTDWRTRLEKLLLGLKKSNVMRYMIHTVRFLVSHIPPRQEMENRYVTWADLSDHSVHKTLNGRRDEFDNTDVNTTLDRRPSLGEN